MKHYLTDYIHNKRRIIQKKRYNRRMKDYLVSKHVGGVEKFDTFRLKVGTKIDADSKLILGSGLCTNDGCVIDSSDSFGIYIGQNLLLAPDVFIRSGNHDYSYFNDAFQNHGHCAKRIEWRGDIYSIVIEDNVWIGRGATVLSGAHIGKGCVIGAGAVVKEDIPEYSIVIGNPAKVVSNRQKHVDFDDREDVCMFE